SLGRVAGRLLCSMVRLGKGGASTLDCIGGGFGPPEGESGALEEYGADSGEGRLPLAVAGPLANGSWGTGILLLVLLTALVTLIASFFYLADEPVGRPADAPDLGLPGLATGVAAALAVAGYVVLRSASRPDHVTQRRLATLAVLGLGAAFIALTAAAALEAGLSPASSAYDSAFVGMLGFQWAVMLLLLAMMGAAALWAWRAPRDLRGRGVAFNAALVALFAAPSWVAVLLTLYVVPRLW